MKLENSILQLALNPEGRPKIDVYIRFQKLLRNLNTAPSERVLQF